MESGKYTAVIILCIFRLTVEDEEDMEEKIMRVFLLVSEPKSEKKVGSRKYDCVFFFFAFRA